MKKLFLIIAIFWGLTSYEQKDTLIPLPKVEKEPLIGEIIDTLNDTVLKYRGGWEETKEMFNIVEDTAFGCYGTYFPAYYSDRNYFKGYWSCENTDSTIEIYLIAKDYYFLKDTLILNPAPRIRGINLGKNKEFVYYIIRFSFEGTSYYMLYKLKDNKPLITNDKKFVHIIPFDDKLMAPSLNKDNYDSLKYKNIPLPPKKLIKQQGIYITSSEKIFGVIRDTLVIEPKEMREIYVIKQQKDDIYITINLTKRRIDVDYFVVNDKFISTENPPEKYSELNKYMFPKHKIYLPEYVDMCIKIDDICKIKLNSVLISYIPEKYIHNHNILEKK